MLVAVMKDIITHGLYEQVYGCLPQIYYCDKNHTMHLRKYGLHTAVEHLVKWLHVDKKLYVVEADIHHAYESVNISILVQQLKRVIKDEKFIRLICKFLYYDYDTDTHNDNATKGLMLGYYLGPWLFNFYLKQFDHYMAAYPSIKYLRYVDNIFMVSPNKRKLQHAFDDMKIYLKNKLDFTLNTSSELYRFEYKDPNTGKILGRAVNALGAVIHYNRVGVRKSTLKRFRAKANRLYKKMLAKKKITWHDASSMLSRSALIKHYNVRKYYYKHIRPKIDIKYLKEKLRNYSRSTRKENMRRRKVIDDGLANSVWFTRNKT